MACPGMLAKALPGGQNGPDQNQHSICSHFAIYTVDANRIIGLVGCIWTGTPQDDLTVTTLWEDGKHGGNSQSSLILKNLHAKVCQSQVCPEPLMISADNTPKETKNGITFVFFCWLLCALRNTRFWKIRTVYKLVGHTHSHCDRAFSRIRTALLGKNTSQNTKWQP